MANMSDSLKNSNISLMREVKDHLEKVEKAQVAERNEIQERMREATEEMEKWTEQNERLRSENEMLDFRIKTLKNNVFTLFEDEEADESKFSALRKLVPSSSDGEINNEKGANDVQSLSSKDETTKDVEKSMRKSQTADQWFAELERIRSEHHEWSKAENETDEIEKSLVGNIKENLEEAQKAHVKWRTNIKERLRELIKDNKIMREENAELVSENENLNDKLTYIKTNLINILEWDNKNDPNMAEEEEEERTHVNDEGSVSTAQSFFKNLSRLTEFSLCPGSYTGSLVGFGIGNKQYVASGQADGAIKIWNLKAMRLSTTLKGHIGTVYALTIFERNSKKYLASGSYDRTIKIWNLKTGKLFATLIGHFYPVTCLTTHHIGGQSVLASGSEDKTVRLWNLETNTSIEILKAHRSTVSALKVYEYHDSVYLVSGSRDQTMKIWNLSNRTLVASLTGHTNSVVSLTVMELDDRSVLASGSEDKTIRLWDVKTHEYIGTLDGHTHYVEELTLVECGGTSCLASGSIDGRVRIFDVKNRRVLKTLTYGKRVYALTSFHHGDNAYLVAGGDDDKIKVWKE